MGNTPPRRASMSRELERFSTPTGLYPTCPWEVRAARRLITDKKIAPRFPGREGKESCFTQECPICFMFYPGHLNYSACCKKPICSECYLQLKPPRKHVCCPFCNREAFAVKYSPPAVLNISSVLVEGSNTSPTAIETSGSSQGDEASMSQHFASVEDRQRIQSDLRSQLNLSDRPITTPVEAPRPSLMQSQRPSATTSFVITSAEDAAQLADPRFILASAADAARLEEMMILEAMRRSMRDLNVKKDDEDGHAEDRSHQEEELDGRLAGESDTLRPSQVVLEGRRERRLSSNPFDDDTEGPRVETPARRASSTHWNPFSDQ